MAHEIAEKLLADWGRSNLAQISEIYVIGSMANRAEKVAPGKKSDLDLMIFISDESDFDGLYRDIAEIGLKAGVLVHPLFIRESERAMKMSLPLYANAFSRHRKLL